MTAVLLMTSSHFVKLSDRRAAVASMGEPIVASRELPAHSSGRTIIQMKCFLAAALMLAVSVLGIGESVAQTNAAVPDSHGGNLAAGGRFQHALPPVPKARPYPIREPLMPRLAPREIRVRPHCRRSTAAGSTSPRVLRRPGCPALSGRDRHVRPVQFRQQFRGHEFLK